MSDKDMTPLQRTLHDAYIDQWAYRRRAEDAVNRALGELKKTRDIRDRSQQKLEETHKLLVEHGVAARVESHWPVAMATEREDERGGFSSEAL